jgi:subtilisin
VLDTGIDTDHLDLKDNIVDCVTKVTHFVPDSKSCEDGHGHGTHVAGTIAANGGPDGLGIYGVAPEAKLMVVKVCDRRGWCYSDDIAAGIYYATDGKDGTPGTGDEANIISMSLGGDEPDTLILSAIDYAVENGLLVVAAAGNDGPEDGSIDYPGGYVKVIAVGAIDSNEYVPDWSSRGINDGDYVIEEREVEFGAPGVSVESTYNDGCYAYMSGTSMATPHVSGLAAKLWQGSASETRDYLHSVAKDIWESGDDTATGFGLPIAPVV